MACYNQFAGWSSPVARWAHNPKVAGSNPAPATNLFNKIKSLGEAAMSGLFHFGAECGTSLRIGARRLHPWVRYLVCFRNQVLVDIARDVRLPVACGSSEKD